MLEEIKSLSEDQKIKLLDFLFSLSQDITLFSLVVFLGIPYGNHESDLYIPKSALTDALLNKKYGGSDTVASTFVNQIEGGIWYDIPFAYMPFWDGLFKQIEKAKNENN